MRISDWSSDVCSSDLPNGVESAEIIFVWNEIAMPGDNVQRRMIQRHCPEQPLKLLHDLRRFVAVLIPCLRRFEVASVGTAIGTDGTKLRQTKGLAIIARKSGVEGKSVSVRVDCGGSRKI